MKYIRTEDGIYERIMVVRQVCDDKEVAVIRPDKVEFEPILKEADTIEELCDEAVFFDNNNKPHYKSQEGNIWYLGAGLYTGTLRLGIFTDKGLIYVAKMNDKEELELL